ncbi:hypothetical protein ABIB68_008311 [Bradyrhizobium sp. F1.2.2]
MSRGCTVGLASLLSAIPIGRVLTWSSWVRSCPREARATCFRAHACNRSPRKEQFVAADVDVGPRERRTDLLAPCCRSRLPRNMARTPDHRAARQSFQARVACSVHCAHGSDDAYTRTTRRLRGWSPHVPLILNEMPQPTMLAAFRCCALRGLRAAAARRTALLPAISTQRALSTRAEARCSSGVFRHGVRSNAD